MSTNNGNGAEKKNVKRKGVLRRLINLKTIIILCLILIAISAYQLIVHDKFSFSVNTLSSYSVNADVKFDVIVNDLNDNDYYTGYYYNSKESLYDKIVDKITNDNVTLSAVILDEEGKRVKGTNEKIKTTFDKKNNVEITLPEGLEEGKYTLKLKARKGLFSDEAEKQLDFKTSSNDIITISMDKGIYKPGDEVKFRALVTNSKNDIPVQDDVKVSIYDGNDNRVFYEETKTSEFGIISGVFNLGDEVNSGNYTIEVKLNNTEKKQIFNVDAYTEERFEIAINKGKEVFKTTEKINFEVNAKYFFGEPVVDAKVIVKNLDNDKTKTLTTDSNGIAKYESSFEEEGTYNYLISVTDTSNYLVEKTEKITVNDNAINIDIVPEFSSIIKDIKNRIYIYTNDLNGNPIKTIATLSVGDVNREFTTDEDGIGFVDIAANDFLDQGVQHIAVSVEDENGNVGVANESFEYIKSSNIIRTDKVLYEQGENIEVSVEGFTGGTTNMYVVKNGELIETFEIDSNEKVLELRDTYGLIDIYCPGIVESYDNNSTSTYTSSWNRTKSSENIRLNKRTIFIKPNMDFELALSTDADEYKPSDDMVLKISSNKDEASAYLVSIIDTANLNMADNDLNIDKVKLALQDVRLSDGIDAADLYATIMSGSDEYELEKLLVKQYSNNFSISNSTLNTTFDDDIFENILNYSLLVLIAVIIILVIYYNAKNIDNKAFNFLARTVVNTVLMAIILLPVTYEFFDINNEFVAFVFSLIISGFLYVKFFKKYEEKISKAVYEIALMGITFMLLSFLSYNLGIQLVLIIGLILAIIIYTKREKKWAKVIIGIIKNIIKSYVMIILSVIVYNLLMEIIDINYDFEILIYACVLVGLYIALYKYRDERQKVREKTNSEDTKHKDIFYYIGVGVVVLLVLSSFGVINVSRNFAGNVNSAPMYDSSSDIILDGFTGTVNDSIDINQFEDKSDISSTESSGVDLGLDLNLDLDFNVDNFTSSAEMEESVEQSTIIESEESSDVIDEEEIIKVRNVFLESLTFMPEVIAEKGDIDVDVKLSDNITTWKVQVVGNTKNGDITYSNTEFKVFKDFFVDFTVPNNLKVGDKIKIPVTIYNYTENSLNVSLNIEEADWFKLNSAKESSKLVSAKNSELVYINLEILKQGENKLRVAATANGLSDIIEKIVPVDFKGLEINKISANGNTKEDFSGEVLFTEDYIEGSNTATVNIYPNYLAFAIEGMDSILKMPNGCFEQVSSSLYPDIMVLSYLENSDSDDNEMREKAIEYINTGYQKLLTYEVPGESGGFSLYGRPKAETVLTAYGLMELNDLSKVYTIDEDVLKRMEEFLGSKQKLDGSFEITGYTSVVNTHTDVANNAYIVWALSEYNPESDIVKKGIEYLLTEVDDVEDNYVLGLIVNALINTNDAHKNKYLDVLLENVHEDENSNRYLSSDRKDYMGTSRGMNVQATALASMALTKADKEDLLNQSFINYIIGERGVKSWNNTQTTVLALRAINIYNNETKSKDQTIKVKVGDEEKEVKIEKNGVNFIRLDFDNLDKNERFEISGVKSNIYFEVIKNYYIDYNNIEKSGKFEITRNYSSTSLNVNDILNENINIKNISGDLAQNVMIEVEIPQGFILLDESLEKLVAHDVIEKYESNYGKVLIYVRDFSKEKDIDLQIDFRALYPVEITGGAVKVYDYYNQEVSENLAPENIKVTE